MQCHFGVDVSQQPARDRNQDVQVGQFVDVEFFDLTPYCLSALYFRSDMWLVHEFRGDLVGRLVTRFSCGCRSVFAGPL